MLRQASELKEMLHNTAIFWETFVKIPNDVEVRAPFPATMLIKEELDEESLMRETVYLASSYYQQDDDDKDEFELRTAGSDMEDEHFIDSKPEVNLLNLPVKKEPGFCEICYTCKTAHVVYVI